MRGHERTIIALILAGLCWLQAGTGAAQYAGDLKSQAYVYEDIFPLFGKKLATRGVRFPKPWGVGLTYAFIQQPIDISSISLGIDDSQMVDVSNFIKFKSVESQVQALNARVDLWLFPFLNIYALGNYAPQAKTEVALSEPFALNTTAKQWVAGEGFGFTAAFGAYGVWGTMDANWTWNHAELLNESIRTTLLSPRVGSTVATWGKVKLNLWVGAMAQIIGAETSGSIKLSEALGNPDQAFVDKVNAWYDDLSRLEQMAVDQLVDRINSSGLKDATVHYKLDKKVANRWNMLIGTQLEISESWFIRAEVGFIKRESFMLGFNYRFNTPGL